MATQVRFRGQYCFGDLTTWTPDGFTRHELPGGKSLVHYSGLPVHVHLQRGRYLALIGFCFDHRQPEASPAQIAERLAAFSGVELTAQTRSLAGRWVLITPDIIFHDAGGTMPVIYSRGVVAASSRLVAAYMDRPQPNGLIGAEFRALQGKPRAGQSFPLRQTDYDGVFALLPNHYLDLPAMQPVRYYFGPADYGRLSSKATAPKAAEIIIGILKAMAHRYKLAYAATGGHDSRVLAGALGRAGLAKEVDCFTFKYPFDPSGVHNDIVLARRVATAVGCPHRTIDARSDDPDPAVSDRCRQSEEMMTTGYEGWAERVATEVADDRLILMGWASEIVRCYYRWPGSDKVTARQLADCAGVGRIAGLLPEFERWLAEAEDVHRKSGLPILDLFYWENRVGRWCSAGLNVLNCGADWVTLYSCRDLLDTLLTVREADRGGANQKLYREIVRHLNPAIARIPINPLPLHKRTRKALTLLAKRVVQRLRPPRTLPRSE